MVYATLECVTTDGDFLAGQFIPLGSLGVTANNEGLTFYYGNTNVLLNIDDSVQVINDSGAQYTLTLASWRIDWRAWL